MFDHTSHEGGLAHRNDGQEPTPERGGEFVSAKTLSIQPGRTETALDLRPQIVTGVPREKDHSTLAMLEGPQHRPRSEIELPRPKGESEQAKDRLPRLEVLATAVHTLLTGVVLFLEEILFGERLLFLGRLFLDQLLGEDIALFELLLFRRLLAEDLLVEHRHR